MTSDMLRLIPVFARPARALCLALAVWSGLAAWPGGGPDGRSGLAGPVLAAETPTGATAIDPAAFEELAFRAKGRAVVVGMAAWCGPCREELPILADLYAAHAGSGLAMYGLALDYDGPEAIGPVLRRFGVPFPVYWAGEEAVGRFGLFPIPMLVFIRDGVEVERLVGLQGREVLTEKIAAFLR